MKILYISSLSSERVINQIYKETGNNPGYSIQKFSRLLAQGIKANGADVIALTNPPIIRNISSKFVVCMGCEEENGMIYKYIPFINLPIVKHLCVMIYAFCFVLLWGMTDRKEKAIVCDVLNVSACMGSLLATKINRIQSMGVVTDIYGMMVGRNKSKVDILVGFCANRLHNFYLTLFDKYVLLTEQMNEIVNPKSRPYIVMEALCDISIKEEKMVTRQKLYPRTVLYAGGIFEKYGLKMLVDGFIKSGVDAQLILFGSGSYVEELKSVCSQYPCVEYRGIVANEEVVEEELKASLLVNPRFSTEEFTKYSFPSKNMEYMASGTPVLTTQLPGMPQEYYPYVYLFKEETVDGYAEAIKEILSYTEEQLTNFGVKARGFVLKNKNNVYQGRRVIELFDVNLK